MENGKKYETISLDLSKFKIDPKDISEFVSKNPVETLVNIVSEAVYKDNELKVLQEIIKKIGEENLKLKEITQNYEAYKGNQKEMFGATIIFADKEYFNNGFFKDHEKEQKNKIKKLEKDVKKIEQNSIPKNKIRELIKKYEEEAERVKISYGTGGIYCDIIDTINNLKELLGEDK